MDSPVKGLSSSSTTTTKHKPLVIPKSSAYGGGNNENELNLDQLDSKLPTPKKSSAKHFMSPTISAANKTAVPRKKILGEKNEATSTFTDTYLPKTQNLDSRTSPMRTSFGRSNRSPWVSYSSASEPDDDDDDDHTTFVADTLKPYDPLTNYLSPRPKFLRYKPNRLHQIFLHKENETGNGKHSSADVKRSVSFDSHQAVTEEESSGEDARSSSLSSSQDGSVKVEDERIDKIEGDHDGNDEIRKGKYEFGVKESVSSDSQNDAAEEESAAADVCSSLGSSSQEVPPKEETEKIENSECDHDDDEEEEEEDEEMEKFKEERGWNLKGFLKFVVVLGSLFLSTLYISSMNSATPTLEEATWGSFKNGNQGFQNVTFEDAILKNIEGGSGPFDRRGETHLVGVDQRNIDEGIAVGEMEIHYNMGLLESTDELGDVAELKSGASDDGCEHEGQLQLSDHELESTGEGTDQLLGAGFTENEGDQEMETTREDSDQLQEIETAEKSDSFQVYQVALVSEWVEEIKAVEGITTEGTGKEVENEIERAKDVNSIAVDEIVMLENADIEETKESATISTEIDSMEAIIKQGKIDSIPKPVIGVSIFLTILASLGFFYYSRNRKTSLENSLPMGKPLSESVKAEKISPVLVNVEEKIESIVNPSSMICSREESPKEIHHQSHAPMVELLGELVIGEASSSLRSCGVNGKMLESEESNVSVSQENSRSRIKAQALLSQLEFSTADSPSYGSFTSKKKVVKKEESKGGEVNMLITTTPVRRSSRLRSRSVMSP